MSINWESQLILTCVATRTDDNSTDTSNAPLNISKLHTTSDANERAIYRQVDTNGGVSLDLDAIDDGLGDSHNLTWVKAVILLNNTSNAIVVPSGSFFTALNNTMNIEAEQVVYFTFPTGRSVASGNVMTFTGGTEENLFDLWILGSI